MKKNLRFLLISTVVSILIGCTTVPTTYVPMPRVNKNVKYDEISTNKRFISEITLTDSVMNVKNELLVDQLLERTNNNLIRRGYTLDRTNNEYIFKLHFKINEQISTDLSTYTYNYSINTSSSNYGIGVTNAVNLNKYSLSAYQSNYSKTTLESKKSYEYIVQLEIFDNSEKIYQSNAIWNSYIYSPENEFSYVIRILLSQLPSDNNYIPKVKKVKDSHKTNYFILNLKSRNLFCPALPNPVQFLEGYYSSGSLINPVYAYEAFVDLIRNSEYCLPTGSDYKQDPFDTYLWSNVQLGGRYYIGNTNKISYVLIELTTNERGYYVRSAKTVEREIYKEYLRKQKDWNDFLKEYYSVYE